MLDKHIKKLLYLVKEGKDSIMGGNSELDISKEKWLAEETQNEELILWDSERFHVPWYSL